jgi:hypothetical protein
LRIRIISGSWILIQIRIRLKRWIKIRNKAKIQEFYRLKIKPWRAVEAHNRGPGAENGALEV